MANQSSRKFPSLYAQRRCNNRAWNQLLDGATCSKNGRRKKATERHIVVTMIISIIIDCSVQLTTLKQDTHSWPSYVYYDGGIQCVALLYYSIVSIHHLKLSLDHSSNLSETINWGSVVPVSRSGCRPLTGNRLLGCIIIHSKDFVVVQ